MRDESPEAGLLLCVIKWRMRVCVGVLGLNTRSVPVIIL